MSATGVTAIEVGPELARSNLSLTLVDTTDNEVGHERAGAVTIAGQWHVWPLPPDGLQPVTRAAAHS